MNELAIHVSEDTRIGLDSVDVSDAINWSRSAVRTSPITLSRWLSMEHDRERRDRRISGEAVNPADVSTDGTTVCLW